MEDVIVTKPMLGICHMQACVKKGLDEEEVLRQVNIKNLCGTTNGWMRIVRDEPGQLPVQCEEYNDREHVVIVC